MAATPPTSTRRERLDRLGEHRGHRLDRRLSTANGGNAGAITLTASGAVTVGTPAGSSSTATGDLAAIVARGGN